MRVKYHRRIGNHNILIQFNEIERLAGITSQIEFNKHVIFWDFDNIENKNKLYQDLRSVQDKYDLSDIYVFTDNHKSYRAMCFKIVDLLTMLRIIIDTNGIDVGFIKFTAKRCKATLRLSAKTGRSPQHLEFIVPSFHVPIPKSLETVLYDTPLK